jgi:hypothetical protein
MDTNGDLAHARNSLRSSTGKIDWDLPALQPFHNNDIPVDDDRNVIVGMGFELVKFHSDLRCRNNMPLLTSQMQNVNEV